MLTNDQAAARCVAITDQLLALVRDIETTCHDGQRCNHCRAQTLAYVAARLDLPLAMLPIHKGQGEQG